MKRRVDTLIWRREEGLGIGDYLTYRAGTGVSNLSRDIGIAKGVVSALVFVAMLAAGATVGDCARRTASEQKKCATGAASGGGAVAVASLVMPVLFVLSVIFSIIAVSQATATKK